MEPNNQAPQNPSQPGPSISDSSQPTALPAAGQTIQPSAPPPPSPQPLASPQSPIPPQPLPTQQPQPMPQPVVVNSALPPIPGGMPTAPDATPKPLVVSNNPPDLPISEAVLAQAGTSPVQSPTPKRRWLKPFLIILVTLMVLFAAAAAVYAEVIVPNQPANVLKTAIENSLQQTQVTSVGSLTVAGSGVAAKIDMTYATNTTAKTVQATLNITVSGVTFPIQARLVNDNVYVKVGDLTTIVDLLSTYDPELGTLAQTISGDISNKWIVIDSTLLSESSFNCGLNGNWTLTKGDLQLLENQYKTTPFAVIESHASDTVNGQSAEKLVVNIDDDKLSTYAGSGIFKQLSAIKAMQKCIGNTKSTGTDNQVKSLSDHGKTPLTIWVDKSTKRIVKIAASTTSSDSVKGAGQVTFTYGNVPAITAPADAEPAIQALMSIQKDAQNNPVLTNLFNADNSSSSASSSLTLTQ